jgi:hypothetical protein
MAEHTHTPGPWRAYGAVVLAANPNSPSERVIVADCHTADLPHAVGVANACLIAAAPALKAALEEIATGLHLYFKYHFDTSIDGRLAVMLKQAREALEAARLPS